MRVVATILVLLSFCVSAGAFYSNAWASVSLRLPLTDRWVTDAEGQYRRQSGYAGKTPFDYPLLFSYRHWLHYRPSRRVTVSMSPFAWFRLNPIIRSANDYGLPPADEYRLTVAVKAEQRLALNFAGEGRSALEYRIFPGQDVIRWRNRVALKYRMKNRWLLMPSAELFLNMAGADKHHVFDQWRARADLAHALIGGRLTAAIGYMYLSRLPRQDSRPLAEHDIVVRLLCNLGPGQG